MNAFTLEQRLTWMYEFEQITKKLRESKVDFSKITFSCVDDKKKND